MKGEESCFNVKCSLDLVSCGCNRTTQALSWGKNNLIAYGGCNSIYIYNPKIKTSSGHIVSVLNGHTDRVNCVQWIDNNEEEIISGSSDKKIILWTRKNCQWIIGHIIEGHTDTICGLASVVFHDPNKIKVLLIASASSDSTLKIWRRDENSDFFLIQNLSFGNGFVNAVAMKNLPHGKGVILACGCDDMCIRLYSFRETLFEQILSLSGHEDWVRSLVFTDTIGNNDLLLASSSQDTYVRLWRISLSSDIQQRDKRNLALEEQSFVSYDEKFAIVLESVLIGHEGWVLGVSWSQCQEKTPSLLSVSMDKTMILWMYDEENEVWIDKARMGDVGGITLGYYGCAFGSDNKSIIAYDYHGAFRMWTYDDSDDQWKSVVTVSGHFGEVEDFDWDPAGEFAITASTDQTTRLYALWRRDSFQPTWHEIARPQVHGYDMKCITILNRYQYASGAEEKVIRVFAAPKAFYDSLSHISNIQEEQQVVDTLPLGATVPVLGLSNKAIYEGDIESWSDTKDKQQQPMKASAFAMEDPVPFNPTLISEPPVEEVLVQNTLWPEIRKLYGHGFGIFTIASSSDGSVLATACKASKADHANIIIWDTSTWTQTDSLFAHTLTVTQMCFSPCVDYLLSVSRDRTWALHKKNSENRFKFNLIQKTDKRTSVHTRIIWSCAWSHDSKYFITVSRDKKALMWSFKSDVQCWSVNGDALELNDAVTAVSIASSKTNCGKYIVATGLETGGVSIFTYSENILSNWNEVLNVPKSLSPTLTVKRLRWRPTGKTDVSQDYMYIGICSDDHSFRILRLARSLFS